MLTFNYQLLLNEPISGQATYTSQVFNTDSLSSWTLIVAVAGAITGTTPTLTWSVQASPDGGTTWNQVGPGIAPLTATLLHLAVQYAADTPQGSISAAGSLFRVVAVASAGAVFPQVYADIASQDL